MTACTHRSFAPTANELFKQRYPVYLRRAALVALAVTIVAAWFAPRYEPVPYQMRQQVIEIENYEPLVEFEEPLAPPPRVFPPRDVEPVPENVAETLDWEKYLMEPDLTRGVLPRNYPGAADAPFVASARNPVLLSRPQPDYPEIARMMGLEGVVEVKVLVGTEGNVLDAVVVSGVHPLLNRAALQAARRCSFQPGLQRNFPVKAWVGVPYNFRLH